MSPRVLPQGPPCWSGIPLLLAPGKYAEQQLARDDRSSLENPDLSSCCAHAAAWLSIRRARFIVIVAARVVVMHKISSI